MKPFQVVGDAASAEVIRLPQMQDLADDLLYRSRAATDAAPAARTSES